MSIPLPQLPYDPSKLYEKPLVELTQSAMSSFTGCKQRYVFRYLMLLRRKGFNINLVTGSAVHAGLEVLIDPADPTPMNQRALKVEQAIHRTFDKVLEKDGNLVLGREDKLEHGRAQALAILDAWWIIFGDDIRKWNFLHKEMKVRSQEGADLSSPLWARGAGMVDGVVQDELGHIWLLEHKTRSQLGNLDVLGLELDFQALWYLYLCYYVLPQRGITNLRPMGFLYNAMQKPQHKLNSKGIKDLRERMRNAMVESPSKYFAIEPIIVEEATIERAARDFHKIVAEIDNLGPDNVFRNTRACDDYGGCPYRSLCRERADASDPESVLTLPSMNMYEIAMPHEELEEDSVADVAKSPYA